MPEAHPIGTSVAMLSASDADIGENAEHTYAVTGGPDMGYFYADSIFMAQAGVIRIGQVIRHEAIVNLDRKTGSFRT